MPSLNLMRIEQDPIVSPLSFEDASSGAARSASAGHDVSARAPEPTLNVHITSNAGVASERWSGPVPFCRKDCRRKTGVVHVYVGFPTGMLC